MDQKRKDCDKKTLMNELIQGKELAEQLKTHLDSSTSLETRELLVQKILSCYENALSMLRSDRRKASSTPRSPMDSSPRSEVSDMDIMDHEQKDVFKKRKTFPRWKQQVRTCSGTMLMEGALDDGYSWRKYGQKDILGANFPRGYYRCTYRNVQGCLATKQVQRSDQDPAIFDVTYRGRHTCSQLPLAKEEPKKLDDHFQQQIQQTQNQEIHNQSQDIKLKRELKVEIDFDTDDQKIPPSSTSNLVFSPPPFYFAPPYISSETSESNCFFTIENDLKSSDSDFTEMVSASTSLTNSPIGDIYLTLDPAYFDPDIEFDAIEFCL